MTDQNSNPLLATSLVPLQATKRGPVVVGSQFASIVARPPPTTTTRSFNRQRTLTTSTTECKTTTVLLPSSNNTNYDLPLKFAGDIGVAAGVTFGFSPFLVAIDKAVVQKTAGTHSISRSVMESVTSMVRNPVSFVRSPTFLMMWGVYLATYSTANCCKTFMEHNEKVQEKNLSTTSSNSNNNNRATTTNVGFLSFLGVTAVNSAASMLKDKFYATQFSGASSSSATKVVPLVTYGLWGLRDCMVIGSSFVLPDIVSEFIEKQGSIPKKNALQISQVFCPVVTQLFVTPVQILGLDFYNRPMASLRERFQFQCTHFSPIVVARIGRIAPAYSIGGVGNTYFRNAWREYLLLR
eukprot:CAMPEP_0194242264 /NCGR_PEP_ID=MMETSP0158-20130606/7853_1 /TAXON_ID=33649 /ORGANISM="Thalassionema nitzschioides, Strain L26-B" /LENGTH=351 /DNA_ID=CAMNT_0038977313 /DNA_START=73 /DNA_END=1124 /DNA_ORIENTATION=-